MLTNDLKKGAKIRLKNDWDAEIYDNLKGNIRMAKVYGLETEIGSIYVKDIAWVTLPSGDIEEIELTDKQKKAAKLQEAVGF